MSNETIGDRVRRLREAKGYTQGQLVKKLAFHVSCSRQLLGYWENGKRIIPTEAVIALSEEFGVTCDYILRGIEAEYTDFCEETGLSFETIEMLKANLRSDYVNIMLNTLLKSGSLQYAASDFITYRNLLKEYFELKKYGVDDQHTVEYWNNYGIKIETIKAVEMGEDESASFRDTGQVSKWKIKYHLYECKEMMDFYLYRACKLLESCLKGSEANAEKANAKRTGKRNNTSV